MAVKQCIRALAMASLSHGFVLVWRVGGRRWSGAYLRLLGPTFDQLMAWGAR
jgi:hypothetical protein